MKIILMILMMGFAHAQTLERISTDLNHKLPEVYDSVTKLMRTSVEHNNLKYSFLLDASHKEYRWAMPKVREQVMKNVCKNERERFILKKLNANIVYSYENTKGQSLGEFMIKPSDCP